MICAYGPAVHVALLVTPLSSISLLVALGVRQDGQKVLLAVKNMGAKLNAPQALYGENQDCR